MPNSSPSPTLRPKNTLNLSVSSSSNVSIPVQEVLLEDSTFYYALHCALRDVTSHTRTRLSAAIELADIMETARAALKIIRTTLDDPLRITSWSPNKYDSNKLMNPGSNLTDPDCYFAEHASPKARVLFRITSNISKEIYYRAKRLHDLDRLKLCSMYDSEDSFDSEDYHEDISGWIGRFAKMLEVTKTDEPIVQNEPRKAGSKKRKQANANPSSKRKLIRASSNEVTSPAMQPLSVPCRSNSAHVADTTNQHMPSYQNQPARQTVQRYMFQTDNLAHLATTNYQVGLVASIPEQTHYQEQQSLQNSALHLDEGHQQQEQRQQQGQHQGQQGEEQQQQGQEQEQQSMADAGLGDLIADEMGNQFYPEFLYQYNAAD